MANGDDMAQLTSLMDSTAMGPDSFEEEMEIDIEIAAPGTFVGKVNEVLPEGIEIEPQEDGGVVIDLDPQKMMGIDEGDFYRNLAEELDDRELSSLSSQLLADFESNKASRSEWEDAYSKGLGLLGYTYEERTMPFRGATGVTHPLLAEAATQFQAQAFNELLPPSGPVRTQIVGEKTSDSEAQAFRVKEFMNYYITNVMEEYTPEFDQMLFYLPLAGSTFKKVYYDEAMDRAVSRFVPAEDIVVPYGASDLDSCENITQVVKMTLNDLRIRQVMGFYRDIPVIPSQSNDGEVIDEMSKLEGMEPGNLDYDCTLLECHVNLDLEGFEDMGEDGEPTGIKIPYIVTISEDNGQVLAVRRNFREEDDRRKKIPYFVHYKFLPGFGFYGLGLIHTIGGLSRTATAALRQLIDAGTLSNLPAGFKARGLRVRDDDEPLQPGEFRDVDAPGGAIRDSLMPLPFKGPDTVLFQLLGFVVDAGRRFATITDMKVGDGNQQAAVGTTVALLEQGSRVMSAVHKRLHYGMRQEFKALARVMSEYLPQEYPYAVAGGNRNVMQEDFDDRVDVVPVSNPNSFSQAQRISLAQSQLQMAMQAPQMHDMHEAYRRMYEALGVNDVDKILIAPSSEDPIPKDPAQENMDALDGVQLKAFEGQDHDAHIQTHLIFMTSPTLQALPQAAIALQKHIIEHVKLKCQEMATAQMLQQTGGQPLTSDMELQLEAMIAQLNAQEFAKLKQLTAQISGQNQGDPLIQLKQQELQLDAQKDQRDAQMDQAELQMDQQRMTNKQTEFQQRLASQERQTQARIDAALQRELLKRGD
tara:strand:- start:5930 stop:8365 length:2436 start_codon:yes stop_codon:yes gene_type:complete